MKLRALPQKVIILVCTLDDSRQSFISDEIDAHLMINTT